MPRIRIPAIGVDAFIQEVGLTPAGAIGIPTNYIDAARFTGSSAFGAGNTIVVGHRDTRLFAPGVFRNLERLRAGDEVRVALSDGTQLAYRVARVQAYAENTDKIPEIVGETTRPRLTLITCTGQWNQSVKRYDQRLVVFADLLEGE
jgi:LPXTG-site transpeptidase (sortase) family protein